MSRVFFDYYDGDFVKSKDADMLDKLVLAAHIEYVMKGGKTYAKATDLGKMLHRRV